MTWQSRRVLAILDDPPPKKKIKETTKNQIKLQAPLMVVPFLIIYSLEQLRNVFLQARSLSLLLDTTAKLKHYRVHNGLKGLIFQTFPEIQVWKVY